MGGMNQTGRTRDFSSLTANQHRVLLAAGADEQRLEQGILLSSEENLLSFLAFAEEFISARYSENRFVFTGLDCSLFRQKSVILHAQPEDQPEMRFAVRVVRDQDGGLSAMESYFNLLRQDEVNQYVDELMLGMGFEAKSDLTLAALTDVMVDSAQPLKELFDGGLKLTVSGFVFVRAPARTVQRKAEIERVLLAAGLLGAFSLREVSVNLAYAMDAPRTDLSFVTDRALIYLPGGKEQ